ncbi:hypothetical protein H0I83_29105 (plasmid) [Bacillus thuringiensis serovar fukuokaensis]|nr:hypothetical protein [Bacillus thuringiensis]OTW90261.1 hypothetical protein BK711_30730 [Bacillus thuringiensis serovar fukuokaensis]
MNIFLDERGYFMGFEPKDTVLKIAELDNIRLIKIYFAPGWIVFNSSTGDKSDVFMSISNVTGTVMLNSDKSSQVSFSYILNNNRTLLREVVWNPVFKILYLTKDGGFLTEWRDIVSPDCRLKNYTVTHTWTIPRNIYDDFGKIRTFLSTSSAPWYPCPR